MAAADEIVYVQRDPATRNMLRVLAVGLLPDAVRYGIPPGMQLYRLDLAKTYRLDTDGVTWVEITGGGAALTVQEVDGAPSVAAVTVILFDQADGLVVSDLGGGMARVDLAAIPASVLADWTVATPATIGADQTAYNPGDFDTYRLEATGAERTIHGVLSSLGRVKPRRFANIGASINIRLAHQSVTEGTAANRLICQGAADILLFPGEQAELWYDSTTTRWRAALV